MTNGTISTLSKISSKISPEVCAKIVEGISKNLPYDMAAWYARLSEKTLYLWLKQGREDVAKGIDSIYAKLLQDIKETETAKVIAHITACEDQTERWQARMTILERRWREYFGQDAAQLQELREIFNFFKEKEKGISNGSEVKQMDSEGIAKLTQGQTAQSPESA